MSDAFQNPTPLANEYWSQAVHKFVVGVWEQIQSGSAGGGGGLPVPPDQTDIDITYYGATNNIQTVTYSPSGYTLTLTYAGGGAADNDLLTNVSGA
jgi:hypothetical protein